MKNSLLILAVTILTAWQLKAQLEPTAGNWKTWFIKSGKDYRLPAPSAWRDEIPQLLATQQKMNASLKQQIVFWNTGSPGYRWQDMMSSLWMNDTSYNGIMANLLLNIAIYDATIAAWDSKYTYNRARPFKLDGRVKLYIPKPESPSYPCEHSVAAGVGATIIAHFYPKLADSVNRMAGELMASRVAAGVAFPGDTKAGFELGKKIAEKEIAYTKTFIPGLVWDGKMPQQPGLWQGKPMFPLAGRIKTIVLDSGNQFRPGPPPDFAKDMEELKNFKPTFSSTANAFYFATQPDDVLNKKIFEYNLHLNPPRAARLYAIAAIGIYDGFISCWDAKYTYWGTRPNQYDTTFHPVLFFSPPFPGYPSGHAMIGAVMAGLYSYFFPAEKAVFEQRAKDGAESRFQGGIHFRTDNEVGLEMGKKVAAAIIKKVERDGVKINEEDLPKPHNQKEFKRN